MGASNITNSAEPFPLHNSRMEASRRPHIPHYKLSRALPTPITLRTNSEASISLQAQPSPTRSRNPDVVIGAAEASLITSSDEPFPLRNTVTSSGNSSPFGLQAQPSRPLSCNTRSSNAPQETREYYKLSRAIPSPAGRIYTHSCEAPCMHHHYSTFLSTIKEQTWDKICWPGTNNAQRVA